MKDHVQSDDEWVFQSGSRISTEQIGAAVKTQTRSNLGRVSVSPDCDFRGCSLPFHANSFVASWDRSWPLPHCYCLSLWIIFQCHSTIYNLCSWNSIVKYIRYYPEFLIGRREEPRKTRGWFRTTPWWRMKERRLSFNGFRSGWVVSFMFRSLYPLRKKPQYLFTGDKDGLKAVAKRECSDRAIKLNSPSNKMDVFFSVTGEMYKTD